MALTRLPFALPSPTQAAFLLGGALSTAASIKGTWGYLITETNGDPIMSGIAAGAMGAIIYAGYEVAFNHRGAAKRLSAFAIAASFAVLSSCTIYQHINQPNVAASTAATQQAAQRAQTAADQARAQLEKQQADITATVGSLRRQNDAALHDIETTTAQGGKSAAWQLSALRKGLDTRNTEITALSAKSADIATQLAAQPAPPAAATPITAETAPLSWSMLARASLYEVTTALFLLFGSWYRTDRHGREQAQTITLQVAQREADQARAGLEAAVSAARGLIQTVTDATHTAQQAATAALEAGDTATTQADRALATATAALEAGDTATHAADLAREAGDTADAAQTAALAAAQTAQGAGDTTTKNATDLLQKLDASTTSANKTLAFLETSIAAALQSANQPANTDWRVANPSANRSEINLIPDITNESILLMIKSLGISTDTKGRVTRDKIMEVTGWGKDRAKKSLEDAYQAGHLKARETGRGLEYYYALPADAETPKTPAELPLNNVITLPMARRN